MKSATKEFGRLLRGALPFSVVNPNPQNLLENVLSYNSTDDAGVGTTLIKADGDITVGKDLRLDNGGMEVGTKFDVSSDGVITFGDNLDNGQITWDAGKAIMGGLAGHVLELHSGGSLTMTLDTYGRVFINNTSNLSTANLNIETGGSAGGLKLIAGFTPGDGNDLGAITFAGGDSANDNSVGEASIIAKATGAHSGSTAPTALLFSTKSASLGPGSSPVERMRIDSVGNVEITGTSDVAGGGTNPIYLRIKDLGQDGGGNTWNLDQDFTQLQFYSGDQSLPTDAGVRWSIGTAMQDTSGTQTDLIFRKWSAGASNNGSMRITSDNNVLIGDTSTFPPLPASNDGVFLYAAGSIKVINNTTNGGSSFYGTASSTDVNAVLASGHSLSLFNLDSTDGNLGGHLRFGKADSLSTSYVGGVNISHTNRKGALVFGTSDGSAPLEKMRITSAGNVGINQNNPQYKLDVDGTVNVEGQFRTAMTIASPMLVEVTAGTYWSLGWWQAADNSWWLLGKMSEETSGFTRADAEFYVPLGMIADVPSA